MKKKKKNKKKNNKKKKNKKNNKNKSNKKQMRQALILALAKRVSTSNSILSQEHSESL